mmetsp:Transcript_151134/g.281829  ORF Transcript_151134/g.281829 Transcript_151134/m.281829 type:complete len:154 (+) Transcript_151134:31-492(+)
MGNLFRDLLLTVYESKYEFDASGRLQQKVSAFNVVEEHSHFDTVVATAAFVLVTLMMGVVLYRAANPVKVECRSLCQPRGADPEHAENMLIPSTVVFTEHTVFSENTLVPSVTTAVVEQPAPAVVVEPLESNVEDSQEVPLVVEENTRLIMSC